MKKYEKVPVVKGAGRGKGMGIPTINFDPSIIHDLKPGIYICRVTFGKTGSYWGLAHYGPRPVFGEQEKTLEAWLFEFEQEKNIHQNLDLEIHTFIRPVKNFKSTDEMLEEIDNDVAVATVKIAQLKKVSGA